jgi:hypothetical protein
MQSQRMLLFWLCMALQRAALLVRLAPELKVKLAEMAKRERRSLSKQVEFLLEQCLSRSDQVKETIEINGPTSVKRKVK